MLNKEKVEHSRNYSSKQVLKVIENNRETLNYIEKAVKTGNYDLLNYLHQEAVTGHALLESGMVTVFSLNGVLDKE